MPDSSNTNSAARVDSTLSKGLRILEVLAQSDRDRGVSELARELDLTKSNTFRLLRSLCELGYAETTRDRTYKATLKMWQVGLQTIDNLNLGELARPQMRMLSEISGEAIYLAVQDGLNVTYIDKIESTKPIRSFTPKGGNAPIHCVGTGKALLAANYSAYREALKDNLTRYTDKTITSIRRLDQDMQDTIKRGFAIDHGEYRDQILSFGATIFLPNGEAIAAIGVSAPNINLDQARIKKICSAVKVAADSVTGQLQHPG
ncbi:MAG: IclR family transcriptional regulator [Pseudomonadota bacterium]